MINVEVAELKKRFKKDKATFYRIAGCYVNEKKEKIYTYNKSFEALPEQELFKYLEIATKALSGKIGNNLLNIEFPIEEEKPGGAQAELYALRESEANSEENLNLLYDRIIESYQNPGNYLITLFFDKYDIPVKGKDVDDINDSDLVFHYIIWAVWPVELTQPNLGYIDKDTGLAITSRDWVVRAPEAGFMFPAFNDRAADIHNILFYTKNAQTPHVEIVEDALGCEFNLTSTQRKTSFNNIITTTLSDIPEEEAYNVIIDAEYQLKQMVDAHKAEHGEMAVLRVKEDVIEDLVDGMSIDEDKKDSLVTALTEFFEDENTDASVLVSYKNIPIGEVRAEKKVIAHMLHQKEQELSQYKEKTAAHKYQTKNINGTEYMLVPTEKNTTVIDGVEYVLVPTDEMNNK